MTPQTITERLHAKADAELKARLKKAFADARHEITDGCCKTIFVCGGYLESDRQNQQKSYPIDAHAAIAVMEQLAFDMRRDDERNRVVSEFMEGVERLGSEIDELRGEIER